MRKKIALVFTVVFLTILPQVMRAEDADPAPTQAEWTLMFYMDSDNNLEKPQILFNLQDMINVGSSAKVNIVGLIARSPKGEADDPSSYTNKGIGGLPNWTNAKYVFVEKGKLRDLGDWGKLDMGDPVHLTKFITTAAADFPAKKYALIFGDHGGGWKQILANDTFGHGLDMGKLASGLSKATAKTGKLELIGFDACMMGNFEVARTVSPYAKYMVGSEEVEPGSGWHYDPLLKALEAQPEQDGAAFGKGIVDAYRGLYSDPRMGHRGDAVTLSAVDLSKIDELNAAVSDLAMKNDAYLKAGGKVALQKTGRARSRTEEYGKTEGKSDYKFFDIVDYATNIKAQSADPTIMKAADNVIAATRAAVLKQYSGKAFPHASGLTIWFPSEKGEVEGENYGGFPFSTGLRWGILVTDYTSLISLDTTAPEVSEVETNDADLVKTDVATVTAKVNADDVDDAKFVLAEAGDNGVTIIGAVPDEPDEKGVLHKEWDGTWFTISDGTTQSVCPISDFQEVNEGKGDYLAEVPAQVRHKGSSTWIDVTLYFYLDYKKETLEGEFIYAFQNLKGQIREVELLEGDSVRAVYIHVDNKGAVQKVADTDEKQILHLSQDEGVVVGSERVDPGKYLMGFVVTDFAGNTTEKFVPVTIEP